ncbi:hypothetical protein FKM82_024775 [Ascaphus truei]
MSLASCCSKILPLSPPRVGIGTCRIGMHLSVAKECLCSLKCLATGRHLRSMSSPPLTRAFLMVVRCMAIRSFSILTVFPIYRSPQGHLM